MLASLSTKRTVWLPCGGAGGLWFSVKLEPWAEARLCQVLTGCVKDLDSLSRQTLKGFNLGVI